MGKPVVSTRTITGSTITAQNSGGNSSGSEYCGLHMNNKDPEMKVLISLYVLDVVVH